MKCLAASTFFDVYTGFCIVSCDEDRPSFYELQQKTREEAPENNLGGANKEMKKSGYKHNEVDISDNDD